MRLIHESIYTEFFFEIMYSSGSFARHPDSTLSPALSFHTQGAAWGPAAASTPTPHQPLQQPISVSTSPCRGIRWSAVRLPGAVQPASQSSTDARRMDLRPGADDDRWPVQLSIYEVGAVLCQTKDKEHHAICYARKTLTGP